MPTAWTARAVSKFQEVPAEIHGRAIPAQVTGGIHLDILRENLIPDPYIGQNEWLVQWIGRTDWEFETTFSVSSDAFKEERVDLVCEGLDTVATIWVSGIEVGRGENMHVESRFDIKQALLKNGLRETNIGVRKTNNGLGETNIGVGEEKNGVRYSKSGVGNVNYEVDTPITGDVEEKTGDAEEILGGRIELRSASIRR